MAKDDPTSAGAVLIVGSAILFFVTGGLLFLMCVLLFGAGLIVLGYELEPSSSPWPDGNRITKGLVIAGWCCIVLAALKFSAAALRG